MNKSIILLSALVLLGTFSCTENSEPVATTEAEKTDSVPKEIPLDFNPDTVISSSKDVTVSANASELYGKHCTLCHGIDGTLGKFGATDLSASKMLLNDRIAIIKNGKGIMPSAADKLKEEEIEAVAFYLTNLRR